MAGMTKDGFTIKRQNEVIRELRDGAVPIFQDLVPVGDVLDTSDSSTLGRLIGLYSLPLADLWEAAQQIYLSFDPNSAKGIALDNLVAYGGITRTPPTHTQSPVVFWGDPSTTILTGSGVRAIDNTLYSTLTTVVLDPISCIGAEFKLSSVSQGSTYSITVESSGNTITVSETAGSEDNITTILAKLYNQFSNGSAWLNISTTSESIIVELINIYDVLNASSSGIQLVKVKGRGVVESEDAGFHTQDAHTINNIATPILGWDSADNPVPATPGRDTETDDELRARFRDSKFIRAQNISDALYSALINIPAVEYAAIYENETDDYDATYDLPPHSFKPVVFGGNPVEIARAIWNNKPLGISSQGNTSETIKDSQGFTQTINFERPDYKDIYITITITTGDRFPQGGETQIKMAIVSYFQEFMGIGNDVIYSRLYTPINEVEGHQVTDLRIGISASPSGTSNIPINYNEIASIDTNNIIVNVS